MSDVLLQIEGMSKSFGGNRAVDNVSLTLKKGEVLGLLGHNGAGKSTLIKMISGAISPDAGQYIVGDRQVEVRSPIDARHQGIETIYQTLALAENRNAVENLFLGREITNRLGFLDKVLMERQARDRFEKMKIRMPDLDTPVRRLSGGQRQAIAIARAIHFEANILIMDEPTAALGPEETAKVSALIKELSRQGIGIILISHDLHDVFDLAHRMLVMHTGRTVGTVKTKEVSEQEALEMIIAGSLPKILQDASN
jgi:D-xylose transport system ATP-binding protein